MNPFAAGGVAVGVVGPSLPVPARTSRDPRPVEPTRESSRETDREYQALRRAPPVVQLVVRSAKQFQILLSANSSPPDSSAQTSVEQEREERSREPETFRPRVDVYA